MTEPPDIKSVAPPVRTRTLEGKVLSSFKFFHSLSTFTSRPELLIPHVRSTDIDWESISPELKHACYPYKCDSLFDLLYSTIYYDGKCIPSSHVGELSGSLYENTIRSWIDPENNFKNVSLTRNIHHKPRVDSKFGWNSKVHEIWDFQNYTMETIPVFLKSTVLPYASFATLKAEYFHEENLCRITVKEFGGTLTTETDESLEFYANVVIPKIFDWMSNEYNAGLPKLSRQRARPLTYIQNSTYWYFYDFIKSGPAEYIKSIWQESTDPVKFIHEDIGIAAYIASFIYDNRSSVYRPNRNTNNIDILDLGCGNGLLCFFLFQIFSTFSKNSKVLGFDIRRRKIWSEMLQRKVIGDSTSSLLHHSFKAAEHCPPTPVKVENASIDLQERPIVPHLIDDLINEYQCSKDDPPKKSVWLIGNHSDELTPWISVIARRMNATGFFVIPCCPFDFFKKYQRRAHLPGSSTYLNYIEYVCTIGDQFGYQPTLENLRIPSTKKICVVGLDCSRKFDDGVLESRVNKLMTQLKDGDEGSCLAKFVPRPKEIGKSQNIDGIAAQPIVDKIFNLIIKDYKRDGNQSGTWFTGREDLTFSGIVDLLSHEEKDVLKSKGNGLRTLIKSNRHLFSLHGSVVKLRMPQKEDIGNVSQSSRDKIKTRQCYFHCFHPQGCPLSEDLCTYKH